MVQAGRKLYIIGGLCEEEGVECASVLDLDKKGCSWKQLPLPSSVKDRITPRCASLDEKIYYFDTRFPLEEEKDKDLSLGFLELWPTPGEVGYRCSGAVIADPDKKRIIVRKTCLMMVSCMRTTLTMKPVGAHVFSWSMVVALSDNVAYVHDDESCQLLHAFDLSEGGKPLDVSWSSSVIDGVLISRALVIVPGNGNFWFSLFHLYLIKFKVRRSQDKIICTPLALRVVLIDDTRCLLH